MLSELQKDILNIPSHIFGKHKQCKKHNRTDIYELSESTIGYAYIWWAFLWQIQTIPIGMCGDLQRPLAAPLVAFLLTLYLVSF